MMKTIVCTIGTRPEAIKMAPVVLALASGALGALPGRAHRSASRAGRQRARRLAESSRRRPRRDEAQTAARSAGSATWWRELSRALEHAAPGHGAGPGRHHQRAGDRPRFVPARRSPSDTWKPACAPEICSLLFPRRRTVSWHRTSRRSTSLRLSARERTC